MSRRSFLRGVGAAFAAAGAAKGRAIAPPTAESVVEQWRTIDSITGLPPSVQMLQEKSGWAAFRALMSRQDRLENQRRQLAHMLGGYPPHLASMQSNAPWFRAQRAIAWEEAQRTTVQAYLDRMRAELLGDPKEQA